MPRHIGIAPRLGIPLLIAFGAVGCTDASAGQNTPEVRANASELVWERLTDAAAFPPSYNFPVQVRSDGMFVALHPEGTWLSRDGVDWTRGALPFSGMNGAYLSYVEHQGATWTLGVLSGNYMGFRVDPLIRRTADYESWSTVGRAANLPQLVFYAATSFRGAIWLMGGYDGDRDRAEVWRSTDGLQWELVLAQAPWSPRSGARAIVFRDRMYLIGGSVLDGPASNDIWSTADGIGWVRETDRISEDESGGTPVVFNDQLWLVGANRSGNFSSAVLTSSDGRTWRPESAPWSPRGGVAVWTYDGSLYMTGGKFSTVERGETIFTYRNDVWRLRP